MSECIGEEHEHALQVSPFTYVKEDAQNRPEDRPCGSEVVDGGGPIPVLKEGSRNQAAGYSSSSLHSSAVESSLSLVPFPSRGSSSSPLFICLKVGPLSDGGEKPQNVSMLHMCTRQNKQKLFGGFALPHLNSSQVCFQCMSDIRRHSSCRSTDTWSCSVSWAGSAAEKAQHPQDEGKCNGPFQTPNKDKRTSGVLAGSSGSGPRELTKHQVQAVSRFLWQSSNLVDAPGWSYGPVLGCSVGTTTLRFLTYLSSLVV